MTDRVADKPTEPAIRSELGSILDQLESLPHDDFERRAALLARQEQLRKWLRELPIEHSDEISAQWSERAASKPGDDTKPVIISPGEGGQAGGA